MPCDRNRTSMIAIANADLVDWTYCCQCNRRVFLMRQFAMRVLAGVAGGAPWVLLFAERPRLGPKGGFVRAMAAVAVIYAISVVGRLWAACLFPVERWQSHRTTTRETPRSIEFVPYFSASELAAGSLEMVVERQLSAGNCSCTRMNKRSGGHLRRPRAFLPAGQRHQSAPSDNPRCYQYAEWEDLAQEVFRGVCAPGDI